MIEEQKPLEPEIVKPEDARDQDEITIATKWGSIKDVPVWVFVLFLCMVFLTVFFIFADFKCNLSTGEFQSRPAKIEAIKK